MVKNHTSKNLFKQRKALGLDIFVWSIHHVFFSQPYSARLQELASEMTERQCSGARLSSDGMVFQVAVWSPWASGSCTSWWLNHWTNPFEKYARQNGESSLRIGVKIKKNGWNHHLIKLKLHLRNKPSDCIQLQQFIHVSERPGALKFNKVTKIHSTWELSLGT